MGKKYKLIAIDLDDTLLDDELNISKANLEAIYKAAEKGCVVTIATGRPYISAKRVLKNIEIEVPIITFNGGLIVNLKNDEILHKELLSVATTHKIIHEGRNHGVHINMFVDNQWYVEDENKYSRYYYRLFGFKPKVVKDLTQLNKPAPKIILSSEPETVTKLNKTLRPLFKKEANVFISKPLFLEFVSPNTDKGKALIKLGKMLGISREEIAAIGDSYNDIPMFRQAGLAIAVENAHEAVKREADFVTASHCNNGAAHAIEKIISL